MTNYPMIVVACKLLEAQSRSSEITQSDGPYVAFYVDCNRILASMSALLIVGPKRTLAASHAATGESR